MLIHVTNVSLSKMSPGLISWTSDLYESNYVLKCLLTWCHQNLCIYLLTVQKLLFACETYKMYLQNE